MPIKLKKVKVDTKWTDRKGDAEKAATSAAAAVFGKAKVPKEKDYEVELTVKVELAGKDCKATVPAFLLTEGGKLVPSISVSKGGAATGTFSGDTPPPKLVAELVDGIVSNLLEKLVGVLEKLK